MQNFILTYKRCITLVGKVTDSQLVYTRREIIGGVFCSSLAGLTSIFHSQSRARLHEMRHGAHIGRRPLAPSDSA